MITITPPLPIRDLPGAHPNLSTSHAPGCLVTVDLFFHVEPVDGHQAATGLVPSSPVLGNVGDPESEINALILAYGHRHTFVGTLDLTQEGDMHGDDIYRVTITDNGRAVGDWVL
ncbi:hypothetical protein [Planomonospora sp. ID82291]|uniref:hypothetical protein n=1 Tax=Planomonospora sp. ID82291 TaxID=2738136 RepID=UPI0018C36A17|nr:hypothetical protein [Planomonospora sp. ID82291]MBG0818754.1 hypothetical protein [Planomonospora sp. ID82291]